VLATVATILLAQDGRLSRLDGALLVAAFAVVLGVSWHLGRRQAELRETLEEFARTHTSPALNLLRLAIAAALLWFGARWVVAGALGLGPALGMEALVLGLLPVAIGTALPEVAAAIAAARRGQGDLVAGHVIGSSLVKLLVVGGMALVRDVHVPASFVHVELPASLALAALLLPMLRGDLEVSRAEGGVLLLAFLGWLGLELAMS
jgi:cation:H+ antiporter